MLARRLSFCPLLLCLTLAAAPPAPRDHFAFDPGDDYKLADYTEITGYFKKLDESSERMTLKEIGKSSEGRPIYVAFISSEANLKELDRIREGNGRLALGQATRDEALKLASTGKAVVWIDSGLHATEVAPVQHAPQLAYRLLTGESEEIRRIRDNVIVMQVPVINPDGLDMVAEWYRQNVGTPYELAPLPKLYQKYAGHDNNRDWFMLNLEETRHVSRVLYREWFPHIVYNQHQVAPFPARIFIPPYAEPLNPNIPPAVMDGINVLGGVMRERFARENKPGAISYVGFDAWWNGGLRSVPAFHNMHGILTETALYHYATPGEYRPSDLPERFSNGLPTKEPSIFYDRPWLGGRWALRDAVEYMLTADMAILGHAARHPDQYLFKSWEMATANIEAGRRGGPYAYVVPNAQPDSWSALEMLRRLQGAGVEVWRSQDAFSAGGKEYPAGTFVLPAAQAFRPYLVDLMEPQKYPEIRQGQTGPTKRPYDVAGWTLPYQMGVRVERVERPFEARLERAPDLPRTHAVLDYRQTGAFIALAEALAQGKAVRRSAEGEFLVESKGNGPAWRSAKWEMRVPKVALYAPWNVNIDAGWTQWLFDTFRVPYALVTNQDIRAGKLRERFDAIVMASQSMQSILHGYREGQRAAGGQADPAKSLQRPEFTGGIGTEGASELEQFVRAGGTLIAFESAVQLPLQLFPLGVRGLLGEGQGSGNWYCPGSLLRASFDADQPIGYGMPKEGILMSTGGQAFEITALAKDNHNQRQARALAWYAKENLLASGWVSGERSVAGRAALVEAALGDGKVVLFGFRPQFRGQSFGTFKLVLNAVYHAAARPVE